MRIELVTKKDVPKALKQYTIGAVAKLAGVNEHTVKKWIKAKLLPGFKIPATLHWRVYEDDLFKFIKDNGMKIATKNNPLI